MDAEPHRTELAADLDAEPPSARRGSSPQWDAAPPPTWMPPTWMPHSDPDTARTPKEPLRTTAHRLDATDLDAADLNAESHREHPAAGHPVAQRQSVELGAVNAEQRPQAPAAAHRQRVQSEQVAVSRW